MAEYPIENFNWSPQDKILSSSNVRLGLGINEVPPQTISVVGEYMTVRFFYNPELMHYKYDSIMGCSSLWKNTSYSMKKDQMLGDVSGIKLIILRI